MTECPWRLFEEFADVFYCPCTVQGSRIVKRGPRIVCVCISSAQPCVRKERISEQKKKRGTERGGGGEGEIMLTQSIGGGGKPM